tara:strand:- start:3317 stop:5326 length:2010 start_codon:yes stop_codon:yes gene_type:complete
MGSDEVQRLLSGAKESRSDVILVVTANVLGIHAAANGCNALLSCNTTKPVDFTPTALCNVQAAATTLGENLALSKTLQSIVSTARQRLQLRCDRKKISVPKALKSEKADPVSRGEELTKMVKALHTLQRLGVANKVGVKVRKALNLAPLRAKHVVGFEPYRLSLNSRRKDVFSVLARAVDLSYAAEVANLLKFSVRVKRKKIPAIPCLGVVLSHVEYVRGLLYTVSVSETSRYIEQCELAMAIVLALSDNGTLRLRPELVPREHKLLCSRIVARFATTQTGTKFIAKLLVCLRALGVPENWKTFRMCMRRLVGLQGEDGLWHPGADLKCVEVSSDTPSVFECSKYISDSFVVVTNCGKDGDPAYDAGLRIGDAICRVGDSLIMPGISLAAAKDLILDACSRDSAEKQPTKFWIVPQFEEDYAERQKGSKKVKSETEERQGKATEDGSAALDAMGKEGSSVVAFDDEQGDEQQEEDELEEEDDEDDEEEEEEEDDDDDDDEDDDGDASGGNHIEQGENGDPGNEESSDSDTGEMRDDIEAGVNFSGEDEAMGGNSNDAALDDAADVNDASMKDRIEASVWAVRALCQPSFRGFGPFGYASTNFDAGELQARWKRARDKKLDGQEREDSPQRQRHYRAPLFRQRPRCPLAQPGRPSTSCLRVRPSYLFVCL